LVCRSPSGYSWLKHQPIWPSKASVSRIYASLTSRQCKDGWLEHPSPLTSQWPAIAFWSADPASDPQRFQQVVEWSCDLRKSGYEASVNISEAKKGSQLGLSCGRNRRTDRVRVFHRDGQLPWSYDVAEVVNRFFEKNTWLTSETIRLCPGGSIPREDVPRGRP
jgi:hypothetical protein